MYGRPVEARQPLRRLYLDLPRNVSWTIDPATGKSAVELIGPLEKGVPLEELPRRLPQTAQWSGRVVTFTFEEPIPAGSYRVAVYQSRIKDEEGRVFDLTDASGVWTGWDLDVLPGPTPLPAGDEPEEISLEHVMNPPLRRAAAREVRVYLDGVPVPIGASELSGEVLVVETAAPSSVELEIEYLLPGSTSLYERHLRRSYLPVEDGSACRTAFVSAGPIGRYTWAVYHGRTTEALMPLDDEGRLLVATPVTRPPRKGDPLIAYRSETAQLEGNAYTVVTYEVSPADEALPALEARTLVFPLSIADPDNTPETNPRLFPGALYFPESLPPAADEVVASFDLPLAARLRVRVDGVDLWWGQTRLIPLFVGARRYLGHQAMGLDRPPAELARVRLALWEASREALSFWRCPLPGRVPATMEEYVLTRLAYGWPREDGSQGTVMVRTGDHQWQGKADHGLRRRLTALAELLRQCVEVPPLFPEDELYAMSAYMGSAARPRYVPVPNADAALRLSPPYRRDASGRDYFDPDEHSRPF